MNLPGVAAALRQLADAIEAAPPEAGDGPVARDLTVGDATQVFGRRASTIRGWLERGVLRGYKLRGRDWRISPGAIAEFRAGQASGGRSA